MRLVKDRDRSQERPWNLNPWIFFNLTGQSLQQSKLTLKSALLWTGDGLGGPAVPSDIACAMISYSHICRVPDELDFWALPSHITILPLPYGIYINKSKKPGKDLIVSSQKKKKICLFCVKVATDWFRGWSFNLSANQGQKSNIPVRISIRAAATWLFYVESNTKQGFRANLPFSLMSPCSGTKEKASARGRDCPFGQQGKFMQD